MSVLVNYSDSGSSSDDEPVPAKKPRLPLPSAIKDIRSKADQEEYEKPELHQGRIRSIKHERGNWISYLYIHYPNTEAIIEIQEKIKNYCIENLQVPVECVPELHLSLSRTVVLRHHWIDNWVQQLREKFSSFKSFPLILKPSIKLYSNDEETRSFFGICSDDSNENKLLDAIQRVDSCFDEYKLEKYYQPPSFHVSILWTVHKQRKELEKHITKINEICELIHLRNTDEFTVQANQILCKTGNKLFTINLQ